MSSPQHPTGSGPQPWQDQPPQYPGQNQQQPGGAPGGYGSGPGPYVSAPGQNASAPGPYGSAPGPYGSGPAQYGSAPGPYGSGPAQYGSGPGPYGSAPGPYGSAPGQFGGAPAPKQKTGPGLIGPLTLRDLFLLFAGLLALIALFVPYRIDPLFGISVTVWHWDVAYLSALVFNLLALLVVVAAVLVNKFGNGRLRVGSLSLDQLISVLTAVAFTYAFVDLLTSAVFWRVGAYLAFFAALIAFFAGVFTMIPFFAKEFDGREAIETHPKARPVAKHTPHPAPVANVPGGNAGAPGFAPYGSAPAGGAQGAQYGQGQPGQPGQTQAGQFGQPGQPGQSEFGGFGQPGQSGQPDGSGQSGSAQFAAPGQPGQQDPTGGQGQPGSDQFAQNQNRFGAPEQGQQPNPYAPPVQQEPVGSASSFAAPAENSSESDADSADGPVHSTGDGQTYLGRRDSEAPQHSQSEPTQAFGVGAGNDQTGSRTDLSQGDSRQQVSDSSDSDSGAAAAAASVGVVGAGAGAVAAGTAAANADSERRRGRHAAPDSESDETADSSVSAARSSDDLTASTSGSDSATTTSTSGTDTVSAKDAESRADGQTPTVVSPAESSDFVSKVNSKSSDTNTRASEGASIGGRDTESTSSTAGEGQAAEAAKAESADNAESADSVDSSVNAEAADRTDSVKPSGSSQQTDFSQQSDSAERQTVDQSAGESSATDADSSPEDSGDNANIRSTEATVVSTPAGENVVAGESGDQPSSRNQRTEAPESEEPTQYVPVANYRNRPETENGQTENTRPETENRAPAGAESSDEDTVAQTAIDNEPVPADAGQTRADDGQNNQNNQNNQDGGRTIIQAFWFAVPEPREAVDPTTGMPVFTIYPGDWYLSLEDNGSWFKVRDTDGREGVLRNIEGIQRG